VDIDDATFNLDPKLVERAITPRTKALMPVHLYGQSFDIDPFLEISRRKKIPLVEDAAQAVGATYKGKMVGTFGEMSCFSFYPGKKSWRVRRGWGAGHEQCRLRGARARVARARFHRPVLS